MSLLQHRNASFWAIKTPGVIFDEMRAAKTDMEALGRDISATFRRPFEAQLASATQQFVQTYGRRPCRARRRRSGRALVDAAISHGA